MAAMQFSCPHCGGVFQVDSSLGGQQVSCPHCRGLVALPAMVAPSQPVAPVQNAGQERPLRPAPGFPPQPQAPTGLEQPLPGPQVQRPLRPMPLGSQPAGPSPGHERPLGGPAQVPVRPPGGAGKVAPQVPGLAHGAGGPGRPEAPLSSPPYAGGGMPVSGVAPPGAARVPTTGPQPTAAPLGGIESLLPPGPAGDAAVRPRGGGVGPQAPFSQAGSSTVLPQPAGGPARPIVLPTPDGGTVRLRDPLKTIGSGDDAIELRSRSTVEKETWRFKKNLIMWAAGLLLLGITILILMLLGPIRV